MTLTMELNKTVELLDDNGKSLLLNYAKKLLLENEWDDDELSPEDLYWLEQANQDLRNGETFSHNEVFSS